MPKRNPSRQQRGAADATSGFCSHCQVVHEPCQDCGKVVHIGDWPFCPHPSNPMYFVGSGKLVWTGEQAWGKKKAHSDEHRTDLESSMLEGALSHEEMTRHAFD